MPDPGSSAANAQPYVPTPSERRAAERLAARRRKQAPAPRFKVSRKGDALTIDPDHPDALCNTTLLCDAFSTGDVRFADGLLTQLVNIASRGQELTAKELATVLAFVRGIGPRDPTEALLAAQMVAIHDATMVAARRLKHVETVDQQDSASNMLNKLARTFATQIEALKRYRSSGEQTMRVTHQHVSVTAGQAVVGINQGGGGAHENQSHSHAPEAERPSAASGGPPLLGNEQALRMPLPGAGGEGTERVPHARRASRSADRHG